MSIEDPLTADKMNAQIAKARMIPPEVGRKQRKAIERSLRRHPASKVAAVHELTPLDSLLEEDDLSICKQELAEYELAQKGTRINLEGYRLFRAVGIPDASLRSYYVKSADHDIPERAAINLWLQADPRQLQKLRGLLSVHNARSQKFFQSKGNRIIDDEEEREIVRTLIGLKGISVEDIFQEILRSRAERIGLIKLQIELLENQQKPPVVSPVMAVEQPSTEISETIESVTLASRQEYLLSNWRLFWTKTPWSTDTHHLIPIPTTSKEDTLESLTDIGRGIISIPAKSVIRTLEFHLQKDVIQKALATRNKYGPEGIRDWVKLKRGRDRIFFLVPQPNQHLGIFFVIGRDVAYRNA